MSGSSLPKRLVNEIKQLENKSPEGWSWYWITTDEKKQWASESSDNERLLKTLQDILVVTFECKNYNIPLKFRIIFPEKYPFVTPYIDCVTKIYHPNIYGKHIKLSSLDDNWSPSQTLYSLLNCMANIIREPNKSYPMNTEAMELYIKNPKDYAEKTKELTK